MRTLFCIWHSAPPDMLAGFKGSTSKGKCRRGEGKGGKRTSYCEKCA